MWLRQGLSQPYLGVFSQTIGWYGLFFGYDADRLRPVSVKGRFIAWLYRERTEALSLPNFSCRQAIQLRPRYSSASNREVAIP